MNTKNKLMRVDNVIVATNVGRGLVSLIFAYLKYENRHTIASDHDPETLRFDGALQGYKNRLKACYSPFLTRHLLLL